MKCIQPQVAISSQLYNNECTITYLLYCMQVCNRLAYYKYIRTYIYTYILYIQIICKPGEREAAVSQAVYEKSIIRTPPGGVCIRVRVRMRVCVCACVCVCKCTCMCPYAY